MANEKNLTSWQPGQSGNPKGKPKGAKHISTRIREMLEDESFVYPTLNGRMPQGAPINTIISVLIAKAIDGDLKAIDLLGKYGYGSKIDLDTSVHFLPAPILGCIVPSKFSIDSKSEFMG